MVSHLSSGQPVRHYAWLMLRNNPHTVGTATSTTSASYHDRVWRAPGALGPAYYLLHKDPHLPQGVRTTGDEKEGLGTSGRPPTHLVNARGTGAHHIVGVRVFEGALGRLHDPDTLGPWSITGAANAGKLVCVVGAG